jgi:hypothetical protein
MKQLRLLSAVAMLTLSSNLFAAVFTVNNANPSPGQYTTVAAAVAAASTGDTLMISGTDISYGNMTINKALTLIGPGWVVSGGGISRVAILGDVTFSESNTTFIGLRAFHIVSVNGSLTQLSNVTIHRCIIDTSVDLGSEDWSDCSIEGNIFSQWNAYNITSNTSSWVLTGSSIRNNIFNGYLYYINTSDISNNIFLGTTTTTQIATGGVVSNTFSGNIVIGRTLNSIAVSNNITGNLSWGGSAAWLQTGNITDVNPMFTSYVQNTTHIWAYDYTLQGGSPAIGTGPAGNDIGVYGGDGIFRIDGEPAVPIVRAVNVPGGGVVPANATFNINVISVAHE